MGKISSVTFIHLHPEVWHYKIARALQKKGIATHAFYVRKHNASAYEDAFTSYHTLDVPNLKPLSICNHILKHKKKCARFFKKFFTHKSDVSIHEGPPNILALLTLAAFWRRSKRVFAPYDIQSARPKHTRLLSWQKYFGEKYSFRIADGVIYKEGKGVLELLPNEFSLPKSKLHFPLYALEEWFAQPPFPKKLSEKDGELHIVNIGAFFSKPSPIYQRMAPHYFSLLSQGIHLHFYGDSSKNVLERMKNDPELKDPSLLRYFHLHGFVPQESFTNELSQYDFGLYLTHYTDKVKKDFVKYTSGNKISTYLESGIPLLVKKENETNATLVKENNIGIVVDDLHNIKQKVQSVKFTQLQKNVLRMRKDYTYEKKVDTLLNFLASL